MMNSFLKHRHFLVDLNLSLSLILPVITIKIERKDERDMPEKQTGGRELLGEFAPKFAELNDDVLFGEVWS